MRGRPQGSGQAGQAGQNRGLVAGIRPKKPLTRQKPG